MSVRAADTEHCVCASLCLFVFLCVLYASLLGITISLMLLFFFFGFPGRLVRAKRMVVAANPTEYEYIEGSIPIEWDGKSTASHTLTITIMDK